MKLAISAAIIAFSFPALAQPAAPEDPRVCEVALAAANADLNNILQNAHRSLAQAQVLSQDKANLTKQVEGLQKQIAELKAKYEPAKDEPKK